MEGHEKRGYDPPPIKEVRTEEPKAPMGGDEPEPTVVSDETAEEHAGQDHDPGLGGYIGDRDPKKDMPSVPGAPETHEDAPSHSGEPTTPNEPPASN